MHSLLRPRLGAGGAGRQDSGCEPAATQRQTLTQSVSNLALSCGCFLERSDLALGVGAEKEHQEIICIRELLAFLLHQFLRMSLVVSHAHLLVFRNF